jgi:hypothetical protein
MVMPELGADSARGHRLTVGFSKSTLTPVKSGPVRPPLLGELETAVMNHLWSGGDGEAKAVHAALGKRRGITLNTLQSTLKRLFEKVRQAKRQFRSVGKSWRAVRTGRRTRGWGRSYCRAVVASAKSS